MNFFCILFCLLSVYSTNLDPSYTPNLVPSSGITAASSQRRVTPPSTPIPTRRLLVPDDEDPQLEGDGVEWLLPMELKRRIAEQEKIMVLERAKSKLIADEEKKKKIEAVEISRRRLMSGSLVKEEMIGLTDSTSSKTLPPILSTATGVDQQAMLASVYKIQKLQLDIPEGQLPPILFEVDEFVDEWVIQYNITRNITSFIGNITNKTTDISFEEEKEKEVNSIEQTTTSRLLSTTSLNDRENNTSIKFGLLINNSTTSFLVNTTIISVLEAGYTSGNFSNTTHVIYQRRRKRSFDEILELRKKAREEMIAVANKYGIPITSLSVDHFDKETITSLLSSSSSSSSSSSLLLSNQMSLGIENSQVAEASVLPNGGLSNSGLKRALQATKLGPVFPLHPDDASPNEVLLFSTVTANASVPYKQFIGTIKPVAAKSCNKAAAALCPKALSDCFVQDPTSREKACKCFFENGACYKRAKCHDLLPKADIDMCFNRMFCGSMDICEGNSASTTILHISVAFITIFATIYLVLG
jgi:hypothetical protein